MSTRVTNSMSVRTALSDVNLQRSRLRRIQEQAATGLRVNRPSDDPVSARNALVKRAELEQNAQFERNVAQSLNRVNAADDALTRVHDVILRARDLAVQMSNETNGAEERQLVAVEVADLHNQILSLANTRRNEAFIFSGYTSDTQPFQMLSGFTPSGVAPTVVFQGDESEISVAIDEALDVNVTLNGQRVFLGDADSNGNLDAGKEDLFDLMEDFWVALKTNDEEFIQEILPRMDVAQSQINSERTRLGAVDARLQQGQSILKERAILIDEGLGEAERVDYEEVFSNLLLQETVLRTSIEVASRSLQPSLMDFL